MISAPFVIIKYSSKHTVSSQIEMKLFLCLFLITLSLAGLDARCKIGYRAGVVEFLWTNVAQKRYNAPRYSSFNACIDITPITGQAAIRSNKYYCDIYGGKKCSGNVLRISTTGLKAVPFEARSIRCSCVRNKYFLFWKEIRINWFENQKITT